MISLIILRPVSEPAFAESEIAAGGDRRTAPAVGR
jgi:hypothetical protein